MVPILFMLSLSACQAHLQSSIHDGFEAESLSRLWVGTKFTPSAIETQTAIVRAGTHAARITVHEGDRAGMGGEGQPTERAELMESPDLWAVEDAAYAYSFSLFMPADFPIVPTRLVLAQWKQRCPQPHCDPENPVIAVRYVGGVLRITRQTGAHSTTLYRSRGEVRNRWLDFRVEVRFSRGEAGYVKVWLNGTRVAEYAGVTAYPAAAGYPSPSRFYFKMGLYRDRLAVPMTMYVDEYRKEQLGIAGAIPEPAANGRR